jgi:hypothetical protein
MNIGEEEDPLEIPMPVNPRKIKRETPVPVEPAVPATPVPAKQHVESFQGWIDAGIEVDS